MVITMNEDFKDILQKDENILFSAKGCAKTRAIIAGLPFYVIGTIFLVVFIIILTTVLGNDPVEFCMLIFPGILYLIGAIFTICANADGKHYEVVLTQKRVIVKHGILTTNFRTFSIERVTGNITMNCNQSVFNRHDNAVSLNIRIELYPVGHNNVYIYCPPVYDGREMANKIEEVVKENASKLKIDVIKE